SESGPLPTTPGQAALWSFGKVLRVEVVMSRPIHWERASLAGYRLGLLREVHIPQADGLPSFSCIERLVIERPVDVGVPFVNHSTLCFMLLYVLVGSQEVAITTERLHMTALRPN